MERITFRTPSHIKDMMRDRCLFGPDFDNWMTAAVLVKMDKDDTEGRT